MSTHSTQSGRDNRGRFATGNGFGERRRRTADYRAAFEQAVGPAELSAVVQAMIDRAKRGNVSAARLILEHCLGKPMVRIELPEQLEEYRVAGLPPDLHRQEMLQLIIDEVAELRKSKLAKSNAKPQRTSAKKKSKPRPKRRLRTGK